MEETGKCDVKVNVIPNGLEKKKAFTTNNNLVFIDSMQFKNPSLDALIKHLSQTDVKYLLQEFSDSFLKLLKQKGV